MSGRYLRHANHCEWVETSGCSRLPFNGPSTAVIQFVTPAEILRSLLSVEERGRVQFIADRMARRSRSREHYRIVLEHWRPLLQGSIERSEALDRIAAELVR